MTEIQTRNGIKKGDEVIFTGPSRIHAQHGKFAQSILKKGKAYIVEFVFPGDDFEQVESVHIILFEISLPDDDQTN